MRNPTAQPTMPGSRAGVNGMVNIGKAAGLVFIMLARSEFGNSDSSPTVLYPVGLQPFSRHALKKLRARADSGRVPGCCFDRRFSYCVLLLTKCLLYNCESGCLEYACLRRNRSQSDGIRVRKNLLFKHQVIVKKGSDSGRNMTPVFPERK